MRCWRFFRGAFLLTVVMLALSPAIASFAGQIIYTYDELNRLKTETYPDTTKIEYTYDQLGNRTAKTVTLPYYAVTATAGCGGSISPGSASVKKGSSQAFTVLPDTGYHIASVTGCSGTLSGTTYTTGIITSACNVTATFAINTYQLSVSIQTQPTGGGIGGTVNVSASPNNFDCTANPISLSPPNFTCYDANCSATYTYGTSVTLTANAYKGNSNYWYDFTGWSGNCSGTGTCPAFTMDSAKSVTASFIQTFLITAVANSFGYIDTNANVCSSSEGTGCFSKYIKVQLGNSVNVTARPGPEAIISKVKVDNVLQAITDRYSFPWLFGNVISDHIIMALFACDNPPPPARIIRNPIPIYYATLQDAYNNAANGDIIQTIAQGFSVDNNILNIAKSISLDGGYHCNYIDRFGPLSGITGMVNITDGTSTIGTYSIDTINSGGDNEQNCVVTDRHSIPACD